MKCHVWTKIIVWWEVLSTDNPSSEWDKFSQAVIRSSQICLMLTTQMDFYSFMEMY